MKGKTNITAIGGLVVGAVGANYVSKTASKMLPAVGKFSGAVPLVLGYFLAGMKNDFAKNAGLGMVAAGGASLIGGVIPGVTSASSPVNEDLSEDILTEDMNEDLSEDVLTEDLTEDVLTEDMNEDLSEDVLTEDLTEDLA